MTKSQSDLKEVVEELRAKEFPTLDSGLVERILEIESDFCDNPPEAQKRILREAELEIEKEMEES